MVKGACNFNPEKGAVRHGERQYQYAQGAPIYNQSAGRKKLNRDNSLDTSNRNFGPQGPPQYDFYQRN